MTLLDTNAILRYLLNDIQEQAEQTSKVLKEGAFTLPEIIAEVVYVLVKLYGVPREKICEIVSPIFDELFIENEFAMKYALLTFSESKFDFVDCIIISRSKILGETVFTFDKKLKNKIAKLTGCL